MNVAFTPEVLTVLVPYNVAPEVPVPDVMDTVTGTDEAEETVLPYWSCMATTGWVENSLPVPAPPGSVSNPSWAGAAGEMLKAVLVALVTHELDADSWYPDAAVSMYKESNTAIPLTAVTVVVPLSCAERSPVSATIDIVISNTASVTTLPKESVTATDGLSADVSPAVPPAGSTEKVRESAFEGMMSNVEETTLVSPEPEKVRV